MFFLTHIKGGVSVWVRLLFKCMTGAAKTHVHGLRRRHV